MPNVPNVKLEKINALFSLDKFKNLIPLLFEIGQDYAIIDLLSKLGLIDINTSDRHNERSTFELCSITYNNKIVGIIGLEYPNEHSVWVGWFVVDKLYQKKGIGTTALKKIIENIKKGEKDVYVSAFNTFQTIAFYESCGFEQISSAKKFRKKYNYDKEFLFNPTDIIMLRRY